MGTASDIPVRFRNLHVSAGSRPGQLSGSLSSTDGTSKPAASMASNRASHASFSRWTSAAY